VEEDMGVEKEKSDLSATIDSQRDEIEARNAQIEQLQAQLEQAKNQLKLKGQALKQSQSKSPQQQVSTMDSVIKECDCGKQCLSGVSKLIVKSDGIS
jgi:chromosome segregation ATPase